MMGARAIVVDAAEEFVEGLEGGGCALAADGGDVGRQCGEARGEGGWIGITVEVGKTGERARSDQVRGTGLGLSLVAEIAKAHGGSVTGENLAAGGAAFTLRLPVARLEEYDEFAYSAG